MVDQCRLAPGAVAARYGEEQTQARDHAQHEEQTRKAAEDRQVFWDRKRKQKEGLTNTCAILLPWKI